MVTRTGKEINRRGKSKSLFGPTKKTPIFFEGGGAEILRRIMKTIMNYVFI